MTGESFIEAIDYCKVYNSISEWYRKHEFCNLTPPLVYDILETAFNFVITHRL